jgi:hypothetical protein
MRERKVGQKIMKVKEKEIQHSTFLDPTARSFGSLDKIDSI